MIAKGKREQQFRGPQVTGLKRLLSGLGLLGGVFIGARGEQRTNAAREGSRSRPLGYRSPAEPQRPWEPGSAHVLGDGWARGGPRSRGSCRPSGVPDSQQREERERCGKRLCGWSCLSSTRQHRGCTRQPTGDFPPTTEPVQASYSRRSLSCRRRLFLPFPVF